MAMLRHHLLFIVPYDTLPLLCSYLTINVVSPGSVTIPYTTT